MGVQTDLSIRGGSFEQVALWVDGIRWSAPHTGHHLLNLPLDPEDIQRIRIVRGGSGALGSGGMTGGVIINTEPDNSNGAEASFEAGSYGWNRSRFRIDWGKTSFRHRFSISRAATTGYRANTDMVMQRFRYAGKTVNDLGTWNIRAGHLSSAFGAQDFYTANFPQQFEQVGPVAGPSDLETNVRKDLGHREAGRAPPEPQRPLRAVPRRRGRILREDANGQRHPHVRRRCSPSWYQGANQHRSATFGRARSLRQPLPPSRG